MIASALRSSPRLKRLVSKGKKMGIPESSVMELFQVYRQERTANPTTLGDLLEVLE